MYEKTQQEGVRKIAMARWLGWGKRGNGSSGAEKKGVKERKDAEPKKKHR